MIAYNHTTDELFSLLAIKESGKWTRRFAFINAIAVAVFFFSSLLVIQFDWRLNSHDMYASTMLTQRLVREPRVLLYFFICFASLSWLVGFFALGATGGGAGAAAAAALHGNKRKTASQGDDAVAVQRLLSERVKQINQTTTAAGIRPIRRRRVAILGGTGLVGRALAVRLLDHPTMELGFIIGSPDTAGKPLKQVWEKKERILLERYGAQMWKPLLPMPQALERVIVTGFEQLFEIKDKSNLCVISCIAPALGWMEEKLLACDVNVYSISPHARDRVPLIVPEVNFPQLDHASSKLFKSPNCVSCGVCLVLDAMRKSFGKIEFASITTFQSLSGRGDALYDADLVVGNILPLGNTEEDTNNKIRDEVCRVLNDPGLKISVTAQRVYTQRGHYVDVRLKLAKPPSSARAVMHALEAYRPLAGWNLPDAPEQPIKVSLDAKWPRPVQCMEAEEKASDTKGMSVHVGHITAGTDRVFDVTLSMVVDNIARGAFGAALLIAQVHGEIAKQWEGGEECKA